MPDGRDTAVPRSTLTAITEPARCRDAALPCAPFRDFVLYEKDSIWRYARSTAAQLSVDSREVTASWPGKKDCVTWEDNPLPTVSRLLSEFPGDRWNPYGWVTFEFSHFLHGLTPPESALPLAGTRAFGLGIEHDRALSAELRSDPKEIYGHAISIRSSWLELGSVCTPASVRVDEPMELRFGGTVQHLGSVVSGQLAVGRKPLDPLAAVSPP
jgi:hypothetical protein